MQHYYLYLQNSFKLSFIKYILLTSTQYMRKKRHVLIWHNYCKHGGALTSSHSTKKTVTTMLTYPWKCTVLHCNHLGNTWKPLVLMTRHFHYCPIASEGDNQSVRSSAPVVSRCFPGGYNVKLYISGGRLAWWLLAFLHSVSSCRVR